MTHSGLTLRALLTGALLGALLTPCNIYSGLKIGWTFNMSITALLLSFGFWRLLQRNSSQHTWNLQESNINQTTASSAASIISGGLVAPIPALALISGDNMTLPAMIFWVFAVSFLGIWVAWYLRPGLILDARLAFPAGIATAETMRDIFSHGRTAVARIVALLSAASIAAAVKWWDAAIAMLPRWSPPWKMSSFGQLSPPVTLQNLTFAFEPSPLMIGFGAIIGLRAGLSLGVGALFAWGVLAPWGIAHDHLPRGNTLGSWFDVLIEWLLWPGVSLMVAATLTSLIVRVAQMRRERRSSAGIEANPSADYAVTGSWLWLKRGGLMAAGLLAVIAQIALFDIPWPMALLALPSAFLLAAVAARVVGETGIPPIGAIGKISQLGFGVVAPGQITTNLMTANVAGGAAGQCADLLNDFKAGHLIGAPPQAQVLAQCLGVVVGSVVGSWVYLLLIPDPATQLISAEWPAPAVATWKVVAETLQAGIGAIPISARWAMALGAAVGVVLTLAEQLTPEKLRRFLPSANALGLAFVIPASISLSLCLGALLSAATARWLPGWHARFALAVASGLIAGESIAGVGAALLDMLD